MDCVLPLLFVKILINGTNSLKWEKPIPQTEVAWMRRGLAVASFWTNRRNHVIFHRCAGAELFSRKSTPKPRRAWELGESSSLSWSPSHSDPSRDHQARGLWSTADVHTPPGRERGVGHSGKGWDGARSLPLNEAGSPQGLSEHGAFS